MRFYNQYNQKQRTAFLFILLLITALAIVLPLVLGDDVVRQQTKKCDTTKKCDDGGKCVEGECVYTGCPTGCEAGFYCENDVCVQRKPEEGCTSDKQTPPLLFYLAVAASALFVVFLFLSLLTNGFQVLLTLSALLGIVLAGICIGIYPSKITQRSEVDGKCTGKLLEVHGYARYTGIAIVVVIALVLLLRISKNRFSFGSTLKSGMGASEDNESGDNESTSETLLKLQQQKDLLVEEYEKRIDEKEAILSSLNAQLNRAKSENRRSELTSLIEKTEKEIVEIRDLSNKTLKQPAPNLSLSEALVKLKVLDPLRSQLDTVGDRLDILYQNPGQNKVEIASLEKKSGEIDRELRNLELVTSKSTEQVEEAKKIQKWQTEMQTEMNAPIRKPLSKNPVISTQQTDEGGFGPDKNESEQKRGLRKKKPRPNSLILRDELNLSDVRPERLDRP